MADLLFKVEKYMSREDALTTKRMDGKWKIDDIYEPQHKKKEKKDCSPNQKNKTGSSNLLKKNGKFLPSKYACGKSLVANQGRSKLEVAEAFDFTTTQTRSKEVLPVP